MTRHVPATAIALSFILVGAVPAAAQQGGAAALLNLPDRSVARDNNAGLADFITPRGGQRGNGLIAAYPVASNLRVGVGRFAVPEIARLRTHVERERDPTGVRPRDRGIAAVGISLSF